MGDGKWEMATGRAGWCNDGNLEKARQAGGEREREVFDYTEEVWIITRGARVSDLKWRLAH